MPIEIQFTFKYEGVLIAPNGGALLSDPTATFGIKRNDNDVAVVADGTAFTSNPAPGVYRHTFAAPAPLLSYTAWAEFTHNAVPYRQELTWTDRGEAIVVESDLDDRYGPKNITDWSQLDPDKQDVRDPDRITKAIAQATSEINSFFAGHYALPLSAPVGSAGYDLLRDWGAVTATAWLYRARSQRDESLEGTPLDDRREVRAEMAKWRVKRHPDFTPRIPASDPGPTVYA